MEDFDKGGAGKSLIFKFISILRNVAFENGKATDKDFKYNSVGKETDVLLIDDLNRYHDLEQLNTMATGDTDINLKYGKIIHFDFKDSPKVAATTNYFPDTMHPGVKRRVKIFEINNYFNEVRTPFTIFKHQLIDDWDSEQMNIEINFLITCLELYLNLGLKVPTIVDADIRLLKVKIGADNISSFDLMEINEGMFIKKWHVYRAASIDVSTKGKNKNRKEKIQATKNFESYLKVKGVKFEVTAERVGEFTEHGYKILLC
jgi:hypothetical protein